MLNRAILMGRLTADPELRQTPNGVSVLSFSIACDRNYNSQGGEKICDFINCVAWRQTAEFISKYFHKGSMIAIEGSIQTRNYEDKQGNKRTAVEVVIDRAYFAESKASSGQQRSDFPPPAFDEPPKGASFSIGEFEEVDADDGDLPF